jgi:parvulin-like peptidyl-prolyl isomerase
LGEEDGKLTKLLARRLGVLAAVPLLLVLTSCGDSNPLPSATADVGSLPATAATVNGKSIPTAAVINQAFANDGYAALGHLIDYRLLDEAASAQHVVVTSDELKARETELINQLGSTAFYEQLSNHDITMSLVDDKLRHQIILEKLVEKQMPGPETMLHARTIVVSMRTRQVGDAILAPRTAAEALAIIDSIEAQLKAGTTFQYLARKYSDDTFTKWHGGDLGIIDKSSDPFGGAIWNAAQGLKAGQMAPKPVKSWLGYHVVQVISWSSSPLPSDSAQYAYAEKQHSAALLQQLTETAMDRLRKNAKIDDKLFE